MLIMVENNLTSVEIDILMELWEAIIAKLLVVVDIGGNMTFSERVQKHTPIIEYSSKSTYQVK